jgi:hypothetical protein
MLHIALGVFVGIVAFNLFCGLASALYFIIAGKR